MVNVETPEKIHLAIEQKLAKGCSYIDALIEYANDRGLEIETVAEVVKKSSVIKEKIRSEAKANRLLKVTNDTSTNFFE